MSIKIIKTDNSTVLFKYITETELFDYFKHTTDKKLLTHVIGEKIMI